MLHNLHFILHVHYKACILYNLHAVTCYLAYMLNNRYVIQQHDPEYQLIKFVNCVVYIPPFNVAHVFVVSMPRYMCGEALTMLTGEQLFCIFK